MSTRRPSPRAFRHLLILGVAAGCALLRGAEPPTLPLLWGNLDGAWRFTTDPDEKGDREGWHTPGFDDSAWRELRVPGLWEPQGVTEPRPGQAPQAKGTLPWTDYDGVAWYRRTVVVPAAWRGQALILQLGAVDDLDRTYVNGTLVGETSREARQPSARLRRYGVPAALVRYGEANTIAIQVRDLGGPGGIPGPILGLLPETEMTMKPLPAEDRPFEARFREPAGSVRILKIVHGWPRSGDAGEKAVLETLRQQGFGGVVTNVAWGDDYLRNPEAWEQLRRVIAGAREQHMALWLYDEKGYPSGTAGGQVLEGHPEWEAEGLLVAVAQAEGPVTLKLPPGQIVLAAAYPVGRAPDPAAAVSLADSVRSGELTWTPPPGRWQVVAMTRDRIYDGTHAAMNLFRHQPYTNLLLPGPTARFLELTHDAYARELGQDLGAVFQSTFTDEPSLMSAFFSPMPYAVLPWAPGFPAEFARRRGYPLEPELAALAVADTPRARQVRYDFWLTVTEQVRASFTQPIRDWCRAHGVPAGGHLLAEEGLRVHVPFYGSFFACMRDFGAPGIDCLTSLPPQVPWAIARLVSSVADLEGRTVTMSETSDHSQRHRRAGDTRPVRVVTLPEIRGTINRLVVGGINTITSYYSFAGLSAAEMNRLNEYVGRCCTALRGGHQVADIAVLYPVESVWPHYDPSPQHATRQPTAMRIEQAYLGALDSLFSTGRDPTIIDAQALAEATVDGAELVHGQLRWRVVVLPGVETLPAEAWHTLQTFHRAGGVIISLARPPANSATAFPAAAVQAIAQEWFGEATGPVLRGGQAGGTTAFLPAGMESMLPGLLDRLLEPDVRVPPGGPLRVTHRRIEGREVYFVINDSPESYRARITVAAAGAGELWDPETGLSTVLAGPDVELDLDAYDGAVLRWTQSAPRRLLAVAADALGTPTLTDLPAPQVDQSKGEHVAAEAAVAASLGDGRPGWKSVGRVTRSNVDTFLFVRFRCAVPVDGSASDLIVVDLDVPSGQTVAGAAHLFVEDAAAGLFLAPLGFALNEAGPHRVWVPWSRLKPFGGTKGETRSLDRTRLVEFRVGWGGYHGQEGERLEFTAAVPRLGRLGP